MQRRPDLWLDTYRRVRAHVMACRCTSVHSPSHCCRDPSAAPMRRRPLACAVCLARIDGVDLPDARQAVGTRQEAVVVPAECRAQIAPGAVTCWQPSSIGVAARRCIGAATAKNCFRNRVFSATRYSISALLAQYGELVALFTRPATPRRDRRALTSNRECERQPESACRACLSG